MNAIIFGINGQDGFYLQELLLKNDITVIGVSRSKGNWQQGNIEDIAFVKALIIKEQPTFIFHLAANSSTSHDALFENHASICNGTLHILESVYKYSPHSKVFLSGSALQFKNEGFPINEESVFEAKSPYAVARIQSVYAARYYRTLGLQVYVGYFFNHDSPRRLEKHISQKIALSVQRIANGRDEKIEIGDISVEKEYTFAGDIVQAIWILLNQNTIYEAVIGSGKSYSIEKWLECCFGIIQKNWKDYVIEKHDFTPEYKILVSNPQIIKSLGWQPKIELEALAHLMIGGK